MTFQIRLPNRQHIKLIAILLLALLVRLPGIASRPIWYDEAFSILFSEKGLGAMLYGTLAATGAGTADIHPLGYYVLLAGWMRLFGQSLPAVRMLSVLAGLGVVGVSYALGRDLFDQNIAHWAALFTALAPFQIHYAQEIRAYVFLALWLLLATWSYVRGRSGHWSWWILFAAASALAQYFHNLAAIYLIPLAATSIISREWKTARAVVLASALALLLYLPWLVHLPEQVSKVAQAYWIERPGFERFLTLILVYVTNLPLPPAWLGPALFISLLVTIFAVWQTIRASRQSAASAPFGRWVLYLAFAPPVLLFLISQVQPIYLERAFLPSHAAYCIWLAWALYRTNLPRFASNTLTVMLAVAALMGSYQHVNFAGFPFGPYQALTADLRANQQAGDVIVHSSKLSMLPAVYYDRELDQAYISDPPGSNTDTLALATQRVLGLQAEASVQSAVDDANRVWFVIFDQSNQEYAHSSQLVHPHIAWLLKEYSIIEVRPWGDLRVYLLAKKP